MSQTFGELARQITDANNAEKRGPDRRVRRHAIDENDAAAQPWASNRFTTSTARYATTDSVIEVARELQREGRAAFPRARLRELKDQQAMLSAELADLTSRPPEQRPMGRPATVRTELAAVEALLATADMRLTVFDLRVLESAMSFLRQTGEWIVAWAGISWAAGCHRNTVGRSLARLRHHGLFRWVARSRKVVDNEGQFLPQREQIAHAYLFSHATDMANRVYQRFLQLREKRFKRMTKRKPATSPGAPLPPLSADALALRTAVTSLGVSIANAST